MNCGGRFYKSKRGRYVKRGNGGVGLGSSMGGNLGGGGLGGGGGEVGSEVGREGGIKGLRCIGGRVMGLVGGGWGLGISVGVGLLIEGIS